VSGWLARIRSALGGRESAGDSAGGTRRHAQDPLQAPVPVPGGQPGAAAAPGSPPVAEIDLDRAGFAWILHGEQGLGRVLAAPAAPLPALSGAERGLLTWLDDALRGLHDDPDLVPRARAVIPQLLASLRDEEQSLHALSGRVSRDPSLVVEVIRMANGASVRPEGGVTELPQAIGRLGTEGLRRAIARVLVRPIFETREDTIFGRASTRLWNLSEAKADAALQFAPGARLDRFEAFLAGMLHNTGWTAVLRLLDRRGTGPDALSEAMVPALIERRDLFFASLMRSWGLSAGLTELADDIIAADGVAGAQSRMARLLQFVDHGAVRALLPARTQATAES
jgi:HD-like signal output (HDOD) protein